ncbi:MAG: hypothetical protein ACE5I3_08115 [Phycisphaerae bacterium]
MQSEQRQPSRLAIGFVVVGLALSAVGIAYMIYAGRERHLPPLTAPEPDPRIEQLEALVRMLTHSFFLFLAFLIGSYLMVRIGRHVLDRKTSRERTEYVDAWGKYRLTQDEIDTATRQLDEDFPPEASPGDAAPQPPPENP